MVDLLAGGRAKPLWVEQHAHIAAEGGIGVGLGADSKSVFENVIVDSLCRKLMHALCGAGFHFELATRLSSSNVRPSCLQGRD